MRRYYVIIADRIEILMDAYHQIGLRPIVRPKREMQDPFLLAVCVQVVAEVTHGDDRASARIRHFSPFALRLISWGQDGTLAGMPSVSGESVAR